MPFQNQNEPAGNHIQESGARILNGGLVTGLPPHLVGAQESPNCTDIDPVYPWGAKTRAGSSKFGVDGPAAGSGSPVGGFKVWIRNAGTQYMIAANGTTIYSLDTGGSWFSIGIGMATDSIMQGAPLNENFIIGASGLALQYSSTGTQMVTVPAGTYLPSFAKFVTQYVSKIWTAGDPGNPSRVSFCKSQDPLDWSTANNAGFVDIGTGDGDIVQAIVGTKRALYYFKRKNAYAITGDSVFNFRADLIAQYGLVSPYAAATDGQGCFFASDDGIYYAVGLNVARISDMVKNTYDTITDKSTIALEVKGEKLFVFYKSTGSANNRALVCAYKRKMDDGQTHGVWSLYTSQNFQTAHTGRTQNIYGVTNSSTPQIYQLDTGTGNISPIWNTPDEDFGDVGIKQMIRFFVHMQPDVNSTALSINAYADGASIGATQTLTFGTVGSHEVQMSPPQNMVRGRFLRLQFTWTNDKVIYGWRMYADVRSEGMPRI